MSTRRSAGARGSWLPPGVFVGDGPCIVRSGRGEINGFPLSAERREQPIAYEGLFHLWGEHAPHLVRGSILAEGEDRVGHDLQYFATIRPSPHPSPLRGEAVPCGLRRGKRDNARL